MKMLGVSNILLKNTTRNDSIDVMRGLAVLFVILLHTYIHIPFLQTDTPEHSLLQELTNIILQSGYYAVIIFFVISGFLITHISIQRWNNLSNINLLQFYQMRVARIFPLLLVLIIILSLLDLFSINGFIIHTTTLQHAIFAALTFHINWLEAKTGYLPGSWDVMWSLSIEEIFYLFFPLTFLLIRNKFLIATIFLILIIAGPCARVLIGNDIWSDKSYLSCMDGIVFGCLAALLMNKTTFTEKAIKICFGAGLILFTLTFIFRKFTFDIGLCAIGLNITLLEIGTALLLIFFHYRLFQYNRWLKILTQPFRWYGKNSYEVYLTHMFVITIFFNSLIAKKLHSASIIIISFVIIILLSGLLGDLIARFFSEPMNKLLRNTRGKNAKKPNLISASD